MNEQGIVVEVSGDTAKIRLTQKSECARCGMCTGAGGGFQMLMIKTVKPLTVNEVVKLDVNQKLLTVSSFLLYGAPLGGFIAGAIIGYIIGKEIMATIFAVGFLVIDFVVIKFVVKKMHLAERIVKVVED